MSSIQNNNFQLFAETALNHAKIGNRFHIDTLLKENYYRIPEDLKNKLLQIITSFAKDSIRTIDRGLLKSSVQDAISAQVEMQAHNTHENPRPQASKTTLFNLPNDLKWTIYSYLDPRELTRLGYVNRSVQKIIFQDILTVLDRNLRSSITNLPFYVKALHLPDIPDVFDISPIKHDKLNKLSLSNSNITDMQLTQIIDRCPNLTTIYLDNCPRITDDAVKELAAKCPLLTAIGLTGCTLITDAAVMGLAAKCPLLTTIGLNDCRLITDAAVKELAANCPRLTTIGLNNCQLITDAAVKELAAKCPLLTTISLNNCQLITDAAVKEVAATCPLLTTISLNNCQLITDAAVKNLAATCPQITLISLSGCRLITDAAVTELAAKCHLLTEIGLGDCQLTDVAVKELAAKCPRLTTIDLRRCLLVTDAAVKELAVKCPLLTKIDLYRTPITAISCIFLAKYSSKLKQIIVAPELQAMFQHYKQVFSYEPYTELGEKYKKVLNDIFNREYGESNNSGFLEGVAKLEREMLNNIDSLNEDDKSKFYLFVHQLANRPPVPNPLQWGKENYKANYARAADALHMLESKIAEHDKPESKKE